jgi:pimeloyl-ACP methyl ester carboxylesterase
MQSDVFSQSSSEDTNTQFYRWRNYNCAYEVRYGDQETGLGAHQPPLLLLHPIGVGLSRHFWDRFCQAWFQAEHAHTTKANWIYNPDLLGCGESDKPHVALRPSDWADQLEHFIQSVIQQPVILAVQGALLPVAIELVQKQRQLVKGVVLSGPPAWKVITQGKPDWRPRLAWNLLLDSPLGKAFYQYARRRSFIQSFSVQQLFDKAEAVDQEWLETLTTAAQDENSRYSVFSFLAGFWRHNWEEAIAQLRVPTLVVVGNRASSISKAGKDEDPNQRLGDYLRHLPQGQGLLVTGRNVLPYESTEKFVKAIAPFIHQCS